LLPHFFADTAFWIALSRSRDQYHRDARAWQDYLLRSGAFVVTTEAVCWEWLNAMSDSATRRIAAHGYERIRHDPRIEVVPQSAELSAGAVRLFTDRSDKDWSLTDCLSFIVMGRRNIREALAADRHFEQAGLRAVLLESPPPS
jgi:predicted nucleic acid-binding protein